MTTFNLIVYILLLIVFVFGYFVGYTSKQEREWIDGYRKGLKDAGVDIKALIEKFSK